MAKLTWRSLPLGLKRALSWSIFTPKGTPKRRVAETTFWLPRSVLTKA